MHATNFLVMNRPPKNNESNAASECTSCSLFFSYFIHTYILYCICVHYIEVFSTERTKNRVHCSELRGVHYIEICFQQKTIRSPTIHVQIGGVLWVEVHIKEVLQSLAFWEHIITNYTIWVPNSLQPTAFHGYIWFWNVLYRLRDDRRINFWLKIKVRIMNIGKDIREIESGPFNMLHPLGNKSSSFRVHFESIQQTAPGFL